LDEYVVGQPPSLTRDILRRRPQLVKGFMQLYSVEQKRSQALEAHAAAFSTIKVALGC